MALRPIPSMRSSQLSYDTMLYTGRSRTSPAGWFPTYEVEIQREDEEPQFVKATFADVHYAEQVRKHIDRTYPKISANTRYRNSITTGN